MEIYTYSDLISDFKCYFVGCGVYGWYDGKVMIEDAETGERGWCSGSLVNDGELEY